MTPGLTSLDLTRFKDLIRARCGLNVEGLGEETLIGAIGKRMAATGIDRAHVYYDRIDTDADEFQECVALLTINETYFYREPEQLNLLTDVLMPLLMRAETTQLPIRILSAGCSTGEEPYSIAIALRERFGPGCSKMVSIVGGDIDRYALAKAKSALYSKFSFRGLNERLRTQYFRPTENGMFALDPTIVEMVRFAPLNLLAGPFETDMRDFDIVFFRNVSIYFDEKTRATIQRYLFEAMTAQGILIMGLAETIANDFGIFRQEETDGLFYFAKTPRGAPSRPKPHTLREPQRPSPPSYTVPAKPPHTRANPAPPSPPPNLDTVIASARANILDTQFARAAAQLQAHNRVAPTDVRLLALEGYARMMERDFARADALAQTALDTDEWSNDAIVLSGLLAKWQKRTDVATRMFQRAVYNRFDCWPAHYFLGEQYRTTGSGDYLRHYRVALQSLKSRPDPDGGLVLPLDLPLADIRALCERHVKASTDDSPPAASPRRPQWRSI